MQDETTLTADAAAIAAGVTRVLRHHDYTSVLEMTLANHRRADVAAIGANGDITIVEIKSSVADFRADNKWPEYIPFCDRFYFAVSHDFPQNLIPEEAGLIIADRFGGAILREPPEFRLAAARRKAMTLRFARLAAARLSQVLDSVPPSA